MEDFETADGAWPGWGETLSDATWQLVQESLHIVPGCGCLRLLYDRGCMERDRMASRPRSLTSAKP